MEADQKILIEFKENACFRLDEGMRMIGISLQQLKEEELWRKPNEQLNSIGNLLLHLCGNVTQYVLSGLGGKIDSRQRDLEFEQTKVADIPGMTHLLVSVVNQAKECIEKTTLEDYLKVREIQGFQLSGTGAVLHAVEHFSYHTGQIAFWVKFLRNTDLHFYEGTNLNTLNQ